MTSTASRSGFTAGDTPDEFVACHRLAAAVLPPARLRTLLIAAHGIPSVAIDPEVWRSPAVALTEKQLARLGYALSEELPANLRETAANLGVRVLTQESEDYPDALRPFSDAPAFLFVRGPLLTDDAQGIAIVGSRRATGYGRGQAERFARAFSERGLTVVSGGAAGIDTAAHRATLNAGGRTIAILGCGLDRSYPSENRKLFEEIVERGGAIVSEFALFTDPEPWHFPARNRIIAGMTRLTLVIESPSGSGALLTATDAARYGREVFAVPGSVADGRSRGCHKLIQDGAGLADSPEDVLNALGMEDDMPYVTAFPSPPRPRYIEKPNKAEKAEAGLFAEQTAPLPSLTPDEEKLLGAFDAETPRHLDVAAVHAELSAPQATVAATLLEMKGLLQRRPGGLYIRAVRR